MKHWKCKWYDNGTEKHDTFVACCAECAEAFAKDEGIELVGEAVTTEEPKGDCCFWCGKEEGKSHHGC